MQVKCKLHGLTKKYKKIEVDSLFFTSDTHFNHRNIIDYSNRPFDSVEEMNETLIANWNKTVKKDSLVFHLGDFAMGRRSEVPGFLEQLNGRIILIPGNHDSPQTIELFADKFDYLPLPTMEIYVDGQKVFMSHYSHRIWNKSHKDAWHLWGHSHGTAEDYGLSFDVGIDALAMNHQIDYRPISFAEVRGLMENRTPALIDHHNPSTNP